jgi:hypothetical protein
MGQKKLPNAFGGYYAAPIAKDYVTLNDSNYQKTLADYFKHPTWDAADAAICGDPPGASGVCLRGSAISQYIGVLPDGSHFSTRTTSTGIADAVPHFGLATSNVGAPNTPTLADESAATTCQTSHAYNLNAVCFDGTNFELVIWSNNANSTTGATAPTWATTPGQTTVWNLVTFECLGTVSLAANTAYYFKAAGCTVAGCSGASSEATVTTANDSAAHMVLLKATAKVGHTSYQVGCSTTTGTEAILTAPFTGAYTGAAYALPAMGCSGSGGFNTADATGNGVGPLGTFTQTIANGSLSVATNSIGSGACATTQQLAVSGAVTTGPPYQRIEATFNGNPTGIVGFEPSTSGMLTVIPFISAGYVNFAVCNNTGSPVIPGSGLAINWALVQ